MTKEGGRREGGFDFSEEDTEVFNIVYTYQWITIIQRTINKFAGKNDNVLVQI